MKGLQVKFMTAVLIVILVALIIPANVFATEANIQVVKTEDNNYIIYVKDLANTEFKFAIATTEDATETELDYINSVTDGDEEENQVALIEKTKVNSGTNYIYIKTDAGTTINAVDFSENSVQIFDIKKMQMVETTTNRIRTELLTNLEERNEVVDGIQYTQTVGGLKIVDEENATYFYESVKLPAEKYSELKELADKLNSEYESKDMYSKIEFAKEFYNLYEELINQATWESVDNMEIRQPSDAQKDEQYVVLLKKVAENGTETYDAKFMISYREDEEEKIPGRTETKVVQETTKLPITGDSIVLFGVLAVIVIALILVFVRMKKLQSKESKH